MNRRVARSALLYGSVFLVLAVAACRKTVNVTISPTAATVKSGETQQFQAAVDGSATAPVLWTVNGIVGGNEQFGTVSATGLYSAPVTNSHREIAVAAAPKFRPSRAAVALVTVTGTSTDAAPEGSAAAPPR